jgi:hypothetical protein
MKPTMTNIVKGPVCGVDVSVGGSYSKEQEGIRFSFCSANCPKWGMGLELRSPASESGEVATYFEAARVIVTVRKVKL